MIRPAIQSRKADMTQFAPEVRHGLDQLVLALDYAQDLDCPLWDFAVEIERLLALGMTTSDLRWLIKRGYLSHAREVTASQDQDRHFDPPEQNLAFAKNTCFVLTEAGQAVLARNPSQVNPAVEEMPVAVDQDHGGLMADLQRDTLSCELALRHPAATPSWDGESRIFLVGEYLIKRFRVPSPNQEAVLSAFQEEGWPTVIDDPLPPVPDTPPKQRLRDTIKGLNLRQATRMIHFRGDGTGQRVLWELVDEPSSSIDSADGPSFRFVA
ncbi:MAG: hypothetical protein WCJ35_23075 [Planctomycetota bacterium]